MSLLSHKHGCNYDLWYKDKTIHSPFSTQAHTGVDQGYRLKYITQSYCLKCQAFWQAYTCTCKCFQRAPSAGQNREPTLGIGDQSTPTPSLGIENKELVRTQQRPSDVRRFKVVFPSPTPLEKIFQVVLFSANHLGKSDKKHYIRNIPNLLYTFSHATYLVASYHK